MEDQLNVFMKGNNLYTDSRDVAAMVGKRHDHLMRDIKKYVGVLTQSKIGFSDFFIESTYKDPTGRTLPCYLITKKGCEFVANKLTGQKGILFTATYINAFHLMEDKLKEHNQDMFALPKDYSSALRELADKVDENNKLKETNAISMCCNNKHKTAGKLKWMFVDEYMLRNGYTEIEQIPKNIYYTGEEKIG